MHESPSRNLGEARIYRDGRGESLPYRFQAPRRVDPGRRYPLVLFLHGAGERGHDNARQLANPDVLALVGDKVQQEHPCYFVAPQCDRQWWWVDTAWLQWEPDQEPPGPSPPMRLVLELFDGLSDELPLDPDRRYVTGLSMGGFGTFDLCLRRPDAVAAAVMVCGGGATPHAREVAHIPFWLFHGAEDDIVPVTYSRELAEALRQAQAEVRYTEYPSVYHRSWIQAYREPELPEWLFSKRRRPRV